MGMENLEKEIIAEANRRAKAILAEAEKQREQILSEARSRAKRQKEAVQTETAARWKHEELEEITRARMEAKEQISREKRLLVERVYEEFIAAVSRKSSAGTLRRLFDIGKKELGSVGSVCVSRADVPEARRLFKGIEVKEADIPGGLILESKDGTQRVDLGFGTLSEVARKRTIRKVNEILFGGK